MHSYELDGRGKIAIVLAAASVLLVWFSDVMLRYLGIEPRWWLSLPSFGGIYCVLHWLFDHYLWRWGALDKMRLARVPNLNGQWTGEIRSSYIPDGKPLRVSVLIRQRWSKLIIRLDAARSRSHSVSATLRVSDLPYPTLDYMYVNEPSPDARETMNAHRGTAMLELKGGVLTGEYYTGRGRREIGTIQLRRE